MSLSGNFDSVSCSDSPSSTENMGSINNKNKTKEKSSYSRKVATIEMHHKRDSKETTASHTGYMPITSCIYELFDIEIFDGPLKLHNLAMQFPKGYSNKIKGIRVVWNSNNEKYDTLRYL